MTPTSPAAVFADARAAMERGDWNAFFACLDRDALVPIAENSFKGLVNREHSGLRELCAEFSFPADAIDRLRDVERTMARLSNEIVKMWTSNVMPANAAEIMQSHKQS